MRTAKIIAIYRIIGVSMYQLNAHPIAITTTKKTNMSAHVFRIFESW
jgi:hypothetical protein